MDEHRRARRKERRRRAIGWGGCGCRRARRGALDRSAGKGAPIQPAARGALAHPAAPGGNERGRPLDRPGRRKHCTSDRRERGSAQRGSRGLPRDSESLLSPAPAGRTGREQAVAGSRRKRRERPGAFWAVLAVAVLSSSRGCRVHLTTTGEPLLHAPTTIKYAPGRVQGRQSCSRHRFLSRTRATASRRTSRPRSRLPDEL